MKSKGQKLWGPAAATLEVISLVDEEVGAQEPAEPAGANESSQLQGKQQSQAVPHNVMK